MAAASGVVRPEAATLLACGAGELLAAVAQFGQRRVEAAEFGDGLVVFGLCLLSLLAE